MKKILILIALALLLAGCSQQTNNQNPQADGAALIMTAAAGTAEALGIDLEEPAATQPPTEIPSPPLEPSPAYMIETIVTTEQLNLRAGPGTFFAILKTLTQGARATTLETTADGSWIKVSTTSGGSIVEGWAAAAFLDLSALESDLPIVSWPANQTISGVVMDGEGLGINDVRVAAILQTDQGEVRGEGTTIGSGEFLIYLPPALNGPFSVEVVALNCNSRITEFLPDGTCKAPEHFPVIWQKTVSLPLESEIEFVYEEGIAFLEGIVAYEDGNGASEILVRGTRQSDGAQSEFVTPVGGKFRLPLGEGTWTVVAVRFESDGTPLISTARVYQVNTRGQTFTPLTIPFGEIVRQ